jgi:hypothetical protein
MFAALLLVIFGEPIRATMLVIVYTPDGFWLGADSARETGGFRTSTVCKIHETKWGILLKAGNSQGTNYEGNHYSTDKEIEDLLATSHSSTDFKTSLRSLFKSDIDAELAFLVQDPSVTPANLETASFDIPIPENLVPTLIRSVVLVNPEEVSPGEVLLVVPKSDLISVGWMNRPKYKYWAPSIFEWHPLADIKPEAMGPHGNITFPGPVRMFGELVTYTKPDAWVQAHPKEAILEMLGLGHTEFPNTIGPPYVLVHITQLKDRKSKIRWVSKGVCPSWAEGFDPRSAQQELRDSLHQKNPN